MKLCALAYGTGTYSRNCMCLASNHAIADQLTVVSGRW